MCGRETESDSLWQMLRDMAQSCRTQGAIEWLFRLRKGGPPRLGNSKIEHRQVFQVNTLNDLKN